MIVTEVTESIVAGDAKLSANVSFENEPQADIDLWFCRPSAYGSLNAPGDPYLMATIIPALALHEDLYIDAPVTEQLLERIESCLVPQILQWNPEFRNVTIRTRNVVPGQSSNLRNEVGSFFSGGLDSWHSLVENQDTITHLIHIHGFEIQLDNSQLWNLAHSRVRDVAKEFGKQAIPIVSNFEEMLKITRQRLEDAGRPYPDFVVKAYIGCQLATVALLLQKRMGRAIIPSSWTMATPPPVGSHPLIEPRLSSDFYGFELKGVNSTRIDKIKFLKNIYPEGLRQLRVCYKNRPEEAIHPNCGKCFKCIRTLMEMRAAGAAPYTDSFHTGIDLRSLRINQQPKGTAEFWQDIADAANESGDTHLANTAAIIKGERFYFPREVKRCMKDLERKFRNPRGKIKD